jgi:RNA 3'-terminal phosphate cyclase
MFFLMTPQVLQTILPALFCAFGHRGVRAEQVAEEAIQRARSYLQTDAPVGHHLADQLLRPLGISAWQRKMIRVNAAARFVRCRSPDIL